MLGRGLCHKVQPSPLLELQQSAFFSQRTWRSCRQLPCEKLPHPDVALLLQRFSFCALLLCHMQHSFALVEEIPERRTVHSGREVKHEIRHGRKCIVAT